MGVQPLGIKKEIQNRPLLQRKVAAESYIGVKVNDWELELFHIIDSSNKIWAVSGTPKGNMYPDVEFEVSKDEYPEFKYLHDKTVFWVSGIISEVSDTGLHIKLKKASVRLSKHGENIKQGDDGVQSKNIPQSTSNKKEWYEKPVGLVFITVVAGLILAYLTNWFGLA